MTKRNIAVKFLYTKFGSYYYLQCKYELRNHSSDNRTKSFPFPTCVPVDRRVLRSHKTIFSVAGALQFRENKEPESDVWIKHNPLYLKVFSLPDTLVSRSADLTKTLNSGVLLSNYIMLLL